MSTALRTGAGRRGRSAREEWVDALDAYSRTVTRVAAKVLPSVASLRITAPVAGGVRTVGSGSAVALAPDGYLLTSAHVVAGRRPPTADPGGSATFSDGRQLSFTLVGADPLSDLAVLRVGADDLAAAELGDAATLRVGQLVVAVGNPLGYAGSVSAGVVSALGRAMAAGGRGAARLVENVIQTDAALHPGNSGGALADGEGRVVGVSTAVVGPGIGQGLGLAVPIDTATRSIISALLHDGRVRRAYLGVAGGSRPLPPAARRLGGAERGVEVVSVVTDSPAAQAGIRPEDLIVAVDAMTVQDMADLQRLMTADRIDQALAVQIVRGGHRRTISVRPAELPAATGPQ